MNHVQHSHESVVAVRRYGETQVAARVYGIEKYIVMGEHDCLVETSVDLRKKDIKADLFCGNRASSSRTVS